MKYNNIKSVLYGFMLLFACSVSLTSCKDWLDKDPEAIIPEDEAFKNFHNFQGFIEDIYNMIPNITNANYCSGWNMGDDAVHNTEGYAHIDHQVDLGNYRTIWNDWGQCWINADRCSLWQSSWKSIRKCNLGLANIDSMVGTIEERNLLLGQLYFFRAWWHFELMTFFGGMPYVDEAFDAAQIPELPRLSFQECADRCAADFQKAYDLLPVKWDETIAGMTTSGENELRVNKFTAICYLGKCYLWAGSPLMKEMEKAKNGGVPELLNASKGGANAKTYDYDKEYCKKAAQALGKALDMVKRGEVEYTLATFEYSNIYDHMLGEEVGEYSQNWYTYKQQWKMPGVKEAIMRGPFPGINVGPWNHLKLFGPKVYGIVDHDNIIHHPTANLIDQYGMANGQPIYLVENGQLVLNPKSGWDPEHPYKNRDPRFYHDIVFDGFHYVLNVEGLTDQQKLCEYCSLYTDGLMRDPANGSSTGYFIQKLSPHQCNRGDGTNAGDWYEWSGAMSAYVPYMRLADVYLMYAEAMVGQMDTDQSPTFLSSAPEYCPLVSAIGAINTLRRRVNTGDWPMEDVQPEFCDTKAHFIDEVRRERAVELAFEGHRWNDLQRWLLLTEPPYTMKYSHEFERLEKDSWFVNHDPAEAKVGNFRRVELITRNLDERHYWFPLPDKDTYIYPEFPQNPGW
ncbi:MAG: RagB/SusD family nutrient uptake outer membrane protein [Prevotella sp.]|nr:RagB/SusD family nutrient uptake outer membrane protein [Prevotella sp.]